MADVVERSLPGLRFRLDVAAALEQELDDAQVAVEGGVMDRRPAVGVGAVDFAAIGSKQKSGDFKPTVF